MHNKYSNNLLPGTLFPFIWHFLKDYKSIVVAFILLAIAAGFWGPFNSILMKYIIHLLPQLENGDTRVIIPASLVVINFIVFDNMTWRSIAYINYKYQGIIKNNIKRSILDYTLTKSYQFFQDSLAGRISDQINTLADNIETILHRILPDFIRGASLLLMSLAASFSVNPVFSCILIIWFICFSSFSLWMSKRLVHLADNHAANESSVSGQLVDSISNHNNVRTFSRKIFELGRMDYFLNSLLNTFKQKEGFIIVLFTIQGIMIATMIGFSIYFLIYFYSLKLVSIGDFALILGLSMELGHMIWYTMSRVNEFNQAYGQCKQSLSALITPFTIQDKPNATTLKCTDGRITFNNVKFHYKGATPFFQNKSIEIKAGQKVGLVGYSGGGKSTFVNLILRLYDVTDGSILIDDQDLKDVTQDSLRDNISLIPQDPSLFHRSIIENIRYGKISATDEEVIEAAKKAHAHEFITELPEGYEALAGERGVKLSGGQRQRIAIARAILKNAPILILDEATSQLDSTTEGLIQDGLNKLMRGKTTIVIAHRLSTLLNVDRILVFDKGKVVEDGTHAELLTKASLYKQLWDTQIGGFLADKKKNDIK